METSLKQMLRNPLVYHQLEVATTIRIIIRYHEELIQVEQEEHLLLYKVLEGPFFYFFIWFDDPHLIQTSMVHKTASLTDEGNSAHFRSSGAYNIKYKLWKLALRGHLKTAKDRTRNFLLTRTMP